MNDNGNRIVGLLALIVGLLFCSTIIGAIIGIPLIIIGLLMFILG